MGSPTTASTAHTCAVIKTTTQHLVTTMPCFQRCCCCVNLRTGGLMMGVMTLALSAFSVVPMAISLSKRTHLAQVVTHILNEYGKDGNQGPRELNMWGTVQDLLQNAATLPDEEDTKVVRLAA